MAKTHDDDLFKDTTMTFGEHLEELRVCLFRAVVGLTLGTLVGLYVGEYFVQFIKTPLEAALKIYYSTQADLDYKSWASERTAQGLSVPYTVDEVKKIAKPDDDSPELIFEIQLVHPGTMFTPESPATSQASKSDDSPPAQDAKVDNAANVKQTGTENQGPRFSRDNLVPVLMWHFLDKDHRVTTQGLGPAEAFSIWMKASLVVGFVLSSPWVFYQVWIFVSAGLYPHERKYVYVFLPISLGLFFLGVSTAFLFVFEPVLTFLFSFNRSLGINPDPRISEWMSFVLLLPLGFGISFQLPLVMLFLNRIGIFDLRAYIEKWRIAVLVIFILSAVLTPADPYSMLLMALPLTILYFGGILLCRYLPKVS
ncbi:MAG: twin-arginine translocase subunit TatC [Planctomycetaceae bacterium]|nr:twin-arginine translocase subunit TatC [Planctomycetaceae bacterium]